jgi:hypothetical protein
MVQRTVLEVSNIVRQTMASRRQSKEQKDTVGRVMHEFKLGELETSRGRKVKNPKQAIAIGLREAGASKYESKSKNRENLKRTKAREWRGVTEGIGASDPEGGRRPDRSSTQRRSAETFPGVRR